MLRSSDKKSMRIDIRALKSDARRSEDGEAYSLLFKSADCRIGVAATVTGTGETSFSLEILIRAFDAHSTRLLSDLSSSLGIMKALERRDYSINHQDDGWIIARKELQSDSIDDELREIARILSTYKKNRHKILEESA